MTSLPPPSRGAVCGGLDYSGPTTFADVETDLVFSEDEDGDAPTVENWLVLVPHQRRALPSEAAAFLSAVIPLPTNSVPH